MVRWRDDYESGDPAVDADHRELLSMINDLTEAIIGRRGREQVRPVLQRLLAYADRHFAEEEGLMRRAGYPGLERHAALHQDFRERAAELTRGFESGHVVLPLTLSQFLMAWFDRHLRGEDVVMIRWVRGEAPAPHPEAGELTAGPAWPGPAARPVAGAGGASA